MKWLAVPAFALVLGSCGKKEEAREAAESVVEAVATAGEKIEEKIEEIVTPPLSPAERAGKLGFAAHLPKDAEMVFAVYDAADTATRVRNSQLWKFLQDEIWADELMDDAALPEEDGALVDEAADVELGAEEDSIVLEEETVDPGDEAAEAPPAAGGMDALWGSEVTVAFGKSSGEQISHLLTLNKRSTYFQMKALARQVVEAARSGDGEALADSFSQSMTASWSSDLLNDPESGIGLFERVQFPPVYIAFRVPEESRELMAQQVAGSLEIANMLGEMVEPVNFDSSGHAFSGYRLVGAKLSETLAANRESIASTVGPENVDRLLSAISGKNLVAATGTVGEYVVFFLGASPEDCRLSETPDESLVAESGLSFVDGFKDKKFAAVSYASKDSLTTVTEAAAGIAYIVEGLRDGLAAADGLGDTRDLEALLQMVSEREAALLELARTEGHGSVAFLEDGLKIESFGGTDQGAFDWKSPAKLAHLGDSEDVALFVNGTADAAYDEKARAYFESLFEAAYAMAVKVAELPSESEEFNKFKQGFGLFDTKFRGDLLAIYDAVRGDFADGLGLEAALVVDLKGEMPKVPGAPKALLEEGRVPRVTVIQPVEDREKLAASWEKIRDSATRILASVSEMAGTEIPMQDPLSSEKDGLATWFFPLPFFSNDFLPSVTVSNDWFALSSSKNQALDLISKAEDENAKRTGLWFKVNFKAIEAYATSTLALLEKEAASPELEAEDAGGIELDADRRKDLTRFARALSEFDSLDVHCRREGGDLRTSLHLKTR